MAIVTLDGVIAGARPPVPYLKAISPTLVAGIPWSAWLVGGAYGAGAAAPTSTVGGTSLSSSAAAVAGALPHTDPAAGKNSYLAQFMATCSGQAGIIQLCDRLNHNATITGGTELSVTATTAQAIVNGALPARDANGAVTGNGVLCGLETEATMGASTSTSETLVYVDTVLGAAQSVTALDTVQSSAVAGTFYRFPLAAGGGGVASTTSLQHQATMTSGHIALVLYRVLAEIVVGSGYGAGAALDALTSGFPQLFNGIVPFLIFIPSATTASTLQGIYQETQG